MGFNFLGEIEKGNYDNRKIARTINLYRNYYKAKTSNKTEPSIEFVNEIYLAYSIEESLNEL